MEESLQDLEERSKAELAVISKQAEYLEKNIKKVCSLLNFFGHWCSCYLLVCLSEYIHLRLYLRDIYDGKEMQVKTKLISLNELRKEVHHIFSANKRILRRTIELST